MMHMLGLMHLGLLIEMKINKKNQQLIKKGKISEQDFTCFMNVRN